MFLESERLIIRTTKVSDAPFYFELFNDPDWIKFINDKGLKSIEETEVYLEDILAKNKKLNGLGFFAVVLKETEELIGTSTILQRERLEFIDIGYGFLPKGRGKGYATEATKLMMEHVKRVYKQEKLYAFTKPNNEQSKKLLKNLGFKFVRKQVVFEGEEDFVFEYVF